MRLQKFMAHAGLCSRRHAECMIRDGRVSVNGVVVQRPGIKVVPGVDRVEVDGKDVVIPDDGHEYWLLYKPAGVVTTVHDPQGRPVAIDYLKHVCRKRIYPVGRLDFDSEGLLLFTDDGELANRMLHPRYKLEKTYNVTVRGRPSIQDMERLAGGVMLDGRMTLPCTVRIVGKSRRQTILEVVLREGRKRQIRRMLEMVQCPVTRLVRVRMGPLMLNGMEPGDKRKLDSKEADILRQACGLPPL